MKKFLYWVEQFKQNILEILLYGIEDKSILFYPLFRNSCLKNYLSAFYKHRKWQLKKKFLFTFYVGFFKWNLMKNLLVTEAGFHYIV